MERLRNLATLVGRILIAVIFLNSGIMKAMHAGMFHDLMLAHHMPAASVYPLLYASMVIEIVCALLLILGLQTRWAAFILFLWLIPVTIVFHVMTGQEVEWLKNIAMMGGLLAFASFGPGAWSLDGADVPALEAGTRRAA
ncbi:MAG: DoxX family protein [Candidatus Binataceae bacterium]